MLSIIKTITIQLLDILKTQNDPRLMEQPCRYEYEPYAGKVDRVWFEAAAAEQELYNPSQ